ncbi:histone-lysine N-methyltransferase SETMAR [Trichonephila clavipes]|uniref:Histone-lysine N-methyltransferase SETMAR n=1 Tax=Trichonephila clavipes TaxID=2585209 RepID=A0A8X6SUV7_TRICX|nr:histone-lysine N-methyltransferase SETMAR [Trichonephila clavipes]
MNGQKEGRNRERSLGYPGFMKPVFTKDSKPLWEKEKVTRAKRDCVTRTHLKKRSPRRFIAPPPSLRNAGIRHSMYLQLVLFHIVLNSNKIADSFSKSATSDTMRGDTCLTFAELSSTKRIELNALWRIPLLSLDSLGKNLVGITNLIFPRDQQTALSSFLSGTLSLLLLDSAGKSFQSVLARTGRPQALDDEALQDTSQMCDELASQFNSSGETIRLHLHRLGKTYRLSKWIPHTLLEVHKQQQVAAYLSLLSRHCRASIFNRVLTSDEKWVLYDTPKRSKHWLSPQDTVQHNPRPPMQPRKIMLCVW